MPKTWVHFIGKSYYSKKAFVQEASLYGVSRRVRVQVLRKMHFGDVVYLVQQKKDVGAVLIGRFRISTLTGFSEEAMQSIQERAMLKEVPGTIEEIMVDRGCGSYRIGAIYQIQEDIPELLSLCDGVEDIGKPLVGGTLEEMQPCILKDIGFRMGFRDFDEKAFLAALEAKQGVSVPVIRGQFYDFSRFLLEIQGYKRK